MGDLMRKVFWTLGRRRYAGYDEFVRAVSEYQAQISPDDNGWVPDAVLAPGPITVTYTAMWKDVDDTLEVPLGEVGRSLSMGRALFELNNATVEFFADADHCFFEGLVPMSTGGYQLRTGS
ncbi:hypothetical protein R5W23_003840 [Gemmata sp. JC673]|uniref:Uncharacterized protein n=1 Tax=Gemmata algarum TaxID=2975278 RepID=A0ABU5F4G7_9BACT|nr:hypothetical protein [Gemmata algarum]MDY3562374.1 hypothetical protein [Gemmata algarum]